MTRVGARNNDDASCMSADLVFTLVVAACLIVDAALVRLLIEICNRFMLPLFPFAVAGLVAVIVVPLSIGPCLRAVATPSHDWPRSIRIYPRNAK